MKLEYMRDVVADARNTVILVRARRGRSPFTLTRHERTLKCHYRARGCFASRLWGVSAHRSRKLAIGI